MRFMPTRVAQDYRRGQPRGRVAGSVAAQVYATLTPMTRRHLHLNSFFLTLFLFSTVAVKKCSSASVSDVQAFEKECLIMSRLNHFNVVRFYGVSRDVGSRFSVDGSLYLVTEYATTLQALFPP